MDISKRKFICKVCDKAISHRTIVGVCQCCWDPNSFIHKKRCWNKLQQRFNEIMGIDHCEQDEETSLANVIYNIKIYTYINVSIIINHRSTK